MGRTALITGASSGIGYELSKLFAADGYDLILVARSEARLHELAAALRQAHHIQATVLACDLSDPNVVETVWSEVERQNLTVDVLVNNAGYGQWGRFVDLDEAELLNMLSLNVLTLTALTRRFLPPMIARGWGRVLNVGSTASFQPVPLLAVYAASKAYVLSFSEALAQETRGTGVRVTALCPGVTRTGFQARARIEGARSPLTMLGVMEAERVARVGYRALMRGQAVAVPGVLNQLIVSAQRLAPRALIRAIGEWMMSPMRSGR